MKDQALAIAGVGVLVFLAHLFQAIFKQTKLPDVLLLILVGIILGPASGLVDPAGFGAIGAVFTTTTLIVLLFQEGCEMPLSAVQRAVRDAAWLAVANFYAVTGAVGLAAHYLAGLPPFPALMFGAIVGSTSPAVVVPLARQLNLAEQSRTVLSLEGALSDVLGIVVVLTLVEIHKVSDYYPGLVLLHVARSFTVASAVGVLGGLLWAVLLDRIRTLKHAMFLTPAFAFVIYGAVEWLGCSGYIGALAFGITLGNLSTPAFSRLARFLPQEQLALTEAEKDFFSEVAFLLKTFFFIYVGLTVQLDEPAIMWLAVLFTGVLLIVRIPVVRLAVGRSTPVADASVMAAMVPKGLAAIVLAALPLQHGFRVGELIQHLTHAMVLVSIVATAVLVFLLGNTPLGRGYGWFFAGFGRPPAPVEAGGDVGEPSIVKR